MSEPGEGLMWELTWHNQRPKSMTVWQKIQSGSRYPGDPWAMVKMFNFILMAVGSHRRVLRIDFGFQRTTLLIFGEWKVRMKAEKSIKRLL